MTLYAVVTSVDGSFFVLWKFVVVVDNYLFVC